MKKFKTKINKQLLIGVLVTASTLGLANAVGAATATVNLGAASSFAVLGYSSITNVPTSVISGDVGLSPSTGANITGLTQTQVSGTIYTTDGAGPGGNVTNPGLLTQAKNDLNAAFTNASNRTPATTLSGLDNQLGGQTLVPGVYSFGNATTANLTAATPLTLSGNGIYIFQATSDLITAAGSSVLLTNGAQACNVFWTVQSSASSFGANSAFVGTVMGYSSLMMKTGASLQGRLLAETAAITLDQNTITAPTTCNAPTVDSITTTSTTTPKFPNTGSFVSQNAAILWVVGIITTVAGMIIVTRKIRAL